MDKYVKKGESALFQTKKALMTMVSLDKNSSSSKIGLATPTYAYRIRMYKVRLSLFCLFVLLACHGQYMH